MTAQQYIHWLNNPYQLTDEDSDTVKNVLGEYPYLQSARALYLKTLHQQRSFLYNNELKKTAAYTTDRDVLFDFIISEEFITYKPLQIESVEAFEADYVEKKPEPTLDETIEKRVLETLVYIENPAKETKLIHKIDQISNSKSEARRKKEEPKVDEEAQQLEEKLEVGTPLDFSENDKFSFTEWLKLTSAQPIERTEEEFLNTKEVFEQETPIDEKQKKLDLINKFIETNPKITPSKNSPTPPVNIDVDDDGEPFYMTETLARIYLEQKKFQKAIQAYEILILKYPEKSSLFANRITDIKKLQEFNTYKSMNTFTIFLVLITIVSLLLVIVIMIQNPKGGGLDSSLGGSTSVGGVQNTNKFLDKSTWTLATALIVLILLSSLSFKGGYSTESKIFDSNTPVVPQALPVAGENQPAEQQNESPAEQPVQENAE